MTNLGKHVEKKRKIAVITGTRAEYGIIQPVLRAISAKPVLDLAIIVTGMHLLPDFGYTIADIQNDGFPITEKIGGLYVDDTSAGMAKSIGTCIRELSQTLDRIRPEILLLLGDRGEMLAGAVAATYMNIIIAHIHGGEISGNVDEPVRHAITKLAHVHLCATTTSAHRIMQMGENPSHVFVVGAPTLDAILTESPIEPSVLQNKYSLDLSRPLLIVLQHPVHTELDDAASQIRETLDAIVALQHQSIIIYPNADAGGRRMINVIQEYEPLPFIQAVPSIPHRDYLSLLRIASVIVGNSSSGIIEAPSLGLPTINIGSRQQGRERAQNVIDIDYKKRDIIDAINRALYDEAFKRRVKRCQNPYYAKRVGTTIADILMRLRITKQLREKRWTQYNEI